MWIFDGLLQAQPRMAGGLSSQVIEPIASASPGWVQNVVNFGGTIWTYHPVQAAAAAVWIQIGLGVWLIASATGWSSRLAGLSSAGWGLVVWVFGEAFGGLFAPGLTWLSGAPGAVLIYVVVGALIALPLRAWAGPRLGRLLLAGTGVFWVGMALLQTLPANGFWQGGGTLTDMVSSMANVTQPHAQSAMLSAFASFTTSQGFAVNLVVVIALAGLGAVFISGRQRLLRVAVPVATVFCLAVWVLVQDLGFPGGLGTDLNSMVPWVLLLWGGYFAVTERTTVPAADEIPVPATAPRPTALRQALAGVGNPRSLVALGAVAVIVLGAAPMAAATADRNADPIIAQAIAGVPVRLDVPAPDFQLVSGESGQHVDLASLRGKVVLLTFLDPVCVGCPQIAQQLHAASRLLGTTNGNQVQLVAIAATAIHSRAEFIRAFDQKQGLTTAPNWLFLTGPGVELQRVWNTYEKIAPTMMSGMMVHSDFVFVIDANGRVRWEVRDAPGPATTSAQSSFAQLLANAARQL
jgi:cytochrome oxidase Cu insertion factor (SCO1/SenC/PrrC family)